MRNSQKRDFSVRKSSPLCGAQTNNRPLLQHRYINEAGEVVKHDDPYAMLEYLGKKGLHA